MVRSWETWVQSSEETRWLAGFWFVWIESQDSGLFDSEFGVKTEIWIWNQAGNQFLLSAAITIGCYCLVLLSVILCNVVLGFCLFVLLWIRMYYSVWYCIRFLIFFIENKGCITQHYLLYDHYSGLLWLVLLSIKLLYAAIFSLFSTFVFFIENKGCITWSYLLYVHCFDHNKSSILYQQTRYC